MLREASYFARMARDCYEFVRTPPKDNPRALIQETLDNREANFLDLMRQVVFANASNPYNQLFQWAGCGYEDLTKAIGADGLESTLEELRKGGVYLSHDEFKGKKPIERSGRRIETRQGDFVNPLVRGMLETTSSGSRSTGTITRPSLAFQLHREAQEAVVLEQFQDPPRVVAAVYPILPSTVGLRRVMSCTRLGMPIERWFTLGGTLRDSGHYRLLTHLLALEARTLGLPVRFPEYLPSNDFSPAAQWIADQRSQGREVLFLAPVSMAVRVAAAAIEHGMDIRGALFLSGAEPLTEAKRAVVERAGAEVYSRYGISELRWVGCSCREMNKGSCVHVMRDSVAVITHRRRAPLTDMELDSLLITTVLPSSAHVLINVEMDDCGTLEPASCDCSLKAMGFTQQIRNIYSYGKLTGQGITLLGTDMLNIIEQRLPDRFGGAPTDYQLVEREGNSQTEIELRVNPRVGVDSQEAVKNFFLSEVKRMWGGSPTCRQWKHTDGVRVVFAEPLMSGNRKIHALHLLGTSPPRSS